MNDLADRLRAERLRRGWTLKDLSGRTRISITVLKALEEGRFNDIGAPFIVQGLLDTCLNALQTGAEPPGAGALTRPFGAKAGPKSVRSRRRTARLIAVLFFFCCALAIFFLTAPSLNQLKGGRTAPASKPSQVTPAEEPQSKTAEPAPAPPALKDEPPQAAQPEQPSPEPVPEKTASEPLPQPLQAPSQALLETVQPAPTAPEPGPESPASEPPPQLPLETAQLEQPSPEPVPEKTASGQAQPPLQAPQPPDLNAASPAPVPAAAPAPIEEQVPAPQIRKEPGHHLEIRADHKTWIQVTMDGKDPESELLHRGEVREWKPSERVRVVIGNAGGVRVEWDGKPLEISRKPGRVVRLSLPDSISAGQ